MAKFELMAELNNLDIEKLKAKGKLFRMHHQGWAINEKTRTAIFIGKSVTKKPITKKKKKGKKKNVRSAKQTQRKNAPFTQ